MSSACWCASIAVKPGAVLITLNDSFIRMSHNRTSPLMLKHAYVMKNSANDTTILHRKTAPRSLNYMAVYYIPLFNGLFSTTTWVSQFQKCKTSLDLNEARDDGVLGCSGISWIICKQSAPCSRQTTTSTPHHSICTGRMLFLTPNQQCQSTEGKIKQ